MSPAISRSGSPSLALPSWRPGAVSTGLPLAGCELLLVLLLGVRSMRSSPCSPQHALQNQRDRKGEGRKPAFLGLTFCWRQGKGCYYHQLGAEPGGGPSGCSLSLVHLRICALSVVELGGLKLRMHGAHYLVFSGVEEEK